MDPGTLGSRLRMARRAARLTQEDVAERFHLDRSAVSAWEIGRSQPDASQVALLAELYRVSADWLLGLSDEGGPRMEPSQPASEREKLLQEVDQLHFHTPGGSRPMTEEEAAYLREIIRSVIEEYTREERRRKGEGECKSGPGGHPEE